MTAASAELVEIVQSETQGSGDGWYEVVVVVGEETSHGKSENAAPLYRKREARHDEPSVRQKWQYPSGIASRESRRGCVYVTRA